MSHFHASRLDKKWAWYMADWKEKQEGHGGPKSLSSMWSKNIWLILLILALNTLGQGQSRVIIWRNFDGLWSSMTQFQTRPKFYGHYYSDKLSWRFSVTFFFKFDLCWTWPSFLLSLDFMEINFLTKFHKDWGSKLCPIVHARYF